MATLAILANTKGQGVPTVILSQSIKLRKPDEVLILMSQNIRGERSMRSFVFDIGEKSRRVSRTLGKLRADLQTAFITERKSRKLTQQAVANSLNVNRS